MDNACVFLMGWKGFIRNSQLSFLNPRFPAPSRNPFQKSVSRKERKARKEKRNKKGSAKFAAFLCVLGVL